MAVDQASDHMEIVRHYFALIEELRKGNEEAVQQVMDLWDQDGIFQFVGAPPVVGTFEGVIAIHTLYKNRSQSHDMPLSLESHGDRPIDVALGIVETNVSHLREHEGRVLAGWRTTVGTTEGHGFDVAGSHQFTFEGDKIKRLRVTVSPKADDSRMESLSLKDLSVADVGRLSLAAWAVV
jgi:hypothetical protein